MMIRSELETNRQQNGEVAQSTKVCDVKWEGASRFARVHAFRVFRVPSRCVPVSSSILFVVCCSCSFQAQAVAKMTLVIPLSANKNTPFVQAVALKPGNGNSCSPPDLALLKAFFSEGVFFLRRHRWCVRFGASWIPGAKSPCSGHPVSDDSGPAVSLSTCRLSSEKKRKRQTRELAKETQCLISTFR